MAFSQQPGDVHRAALSQVFSGDKLTRDQNPAGPAGSGVLMGRATSFMAWTRKGLFLFWFTLKPGKLSGPLIKETEAHQTVRIASKVQTGPGIMGLFGSVRRDEVWHTSSFGRDFLAHCRH